MVSALPVTKGAIVISRFLRMYTENMLLAGLVLIPGIAVYAWSVRPGATFYLNAFSWNLVRAVIANDRGDPCGGAGFRYFRQDEA